MDTEYAYDPKVRDWQYDIAEAMRLGIESSFAKQKPVEIDCVNEIVTAIDNTHGIDGNLHDGGSYQLSVESVFLHGSKSQVKFKIGGKEYQRELADLLVLATRVENGNFKFQRACFIQAKRCSNSSSGKSAARFGINQWQLALLQNFPEFTGISGYFKNQTHDLHNRSGMLGAYGLLSPPGEFVVLSARILNHLLAGRKSLTSKDLVPAILSENRTTNSVGVPQLHSNSFWLEPHKCPFCEVPEFYNYLYHRLRRELQMTRLYLSRESTLICSGLDEFVHSWSELRLGEVWYPGSKAKSDKALSACLQSIIRKVYHTKDKLSQLYQLISDNGIDENNFEDSNEIGKDDISNLGIISIISSINHTKED